MVNRMFANGIMAGMILSQYIVFGAIIVALICLVVILFYRSKLKRISKSTVSTDIAVKQKADSN